MLRTRLYYTAKPFLPWKLRLTLRRWHAKRILRRCGDVWPILESAGRKPEGWPGWPDGKQFALVLTHDVEGQRGLDRVRQLAELEMELGFRSSFNFVPEGEYTVPAALRSWLTDNGFEVGVHDLHHDGRLYRSRTEFRRNAERINHYLREWGAAGFRSGFMLHNLEWLHDLDIQYDASTFDTDPFEPQPDGVGTIFPFFVPRDEERQAKMEDRRSKLGAPPIPDPRSPISDLPSPISELPSPGRRGYIELPYTLVQDYNLFVVLGEKSIDIWKRKTDWIAKWGGMVLLNTHPDYFQFSGGPVAGGHFPARLYREFLEYLRQWDGQSWKALPKEAANHVRTAHAPVLLRQPRRIAMVAHSLYEMDNRIIRYAEALARRGDYVEVFALDAQRGEPRREIREGVVLRRLQRRFSGTGSGKLVQLLSVALFTMTAGLALTLRHSSKRFDLIHVHNIPDFLVFSALLPKLTGARTILDIHDLVPELYASKFSGSNGDPTSGLLKWIERKSCQFADHVIISNHLWRDLLVKRSVRADRCSVFINYADPSVFFRHQRRRQDDRFILLFPGTLQWHQGLDVALRAFAALGSRIPRSEFHIYGDGPVSGALKALAGELGLGGRVQFFDFVPLRHMPQVMADADLGIVPKRAHSFGDQAYSTKIMEFMSQALPAVISRTRIDSYYFDDSVVEFFESENHEALAEAIFGLWQNRQRREILIRNGLAYATEHSWANHCQRYYDLVDALTGRKVHGPTTTDNGQRTDALRSVPFDG